MGWDENKTAGDSPDADLTKRGLNEQSALSAPGGNTSDTPGNATSPSLS